MGGCADQLTASLGQSATAHVVISKSPPSHIAQKYAKVYERIKKERRKHVEDAKKEEASRIKASLKRMRSRSVSKTNATNAENAGVSLDHLHSEQGVWDLGAEVPPPSSIAARKDTVRSRSSPAHNVVLKENTQGEALRLAKIVSTQKQSLTHPLALWSEMHDISFLVSSRPSVLSVAEFPSHTLTAARAQRSERGRGIQLFAFSKHVNTAS